MSFSAKIVADSKNEFGNRLTTFVVTFPRIILAEFNTHRMLSKNSASSRAIPFKKAVAVVKKNPFIPLRWMKDHPGMQGTQFLSPFKKRLCRWLWLIGRTLMVLVATALNKIGLTKQLCNRLIEPWMWHTVIISGTEWDNFFGLRVHEAAEIHIQEIAGLMLDEYNRSVPKLLKAGEWHIPFENEIDEETLLKITKDQSNVSDSSQQYDDCIGYSFEQNKVKVSTVMAARTSYTVVGADMKPLSYSRMIEIHDDMKQATPKHMSPFEHCAQAMDMDRQYYEPWYEPWSGNFFGFIQYRKMIENENIAVDPRVIRK